jgi:integrase
MARIVGRLNSRQVANAKPPKGKRSIVIGDGGNLLLQATLGKEGNVRRSWLFKYELAGRRREMGLGPLHTVGLAEARDKARQLRRQLLEGVDPVAERRKQRQALIAERARTVTFKAVADMYLDLHLDSFRNAKHRQQWRSTLDQYVHSQIGGMAVADVDSPSILKIIQPLWATKAATASRVRGRIERILDYATTAGFRTGDNPAAHVTSALPKPQKGAHHAAVPYAELPAFMAALRSRESLSAKALELTVLTAARTGETLGAVWDEFDLREKIWTVPAERMKAGREHRVPLCDRAVDILRSLPRHGNRPFALNVGAMGEVVKGMRPDVTTHGFRATFRTWASERTAYPDKVVEAALAHAVGEGKVQQAYERGDLLQKRRRLMVEWERFCAMPTKSAPSIERKVVALREVAS